MSAKSLSRLVIGFLVLVTTASSGFAQESAVKGGLAGTVYDTTGAVVPQATVTVTGPTVTKSVSSDQGGNFSFTLLIPGFYTLKAEKAGFKVAQIKSIEVVTNRTTTVNLTLEVGAETQTVEVTSAAILVDTNSTRLGANLSDTLYTQIPVARNISGLFYLAPGVASGGGTGTANPSISGATGLENLYVADGVNITDSAFGGLGVFSRSYGPLATGINLSFVKEVQVKTGGFEAEYGKATGGIVQIVTKSGGSEYHGSIGAFFAPQQLEGQRRHPDDFGRNNLAGKTLHQENADASAEFGGYVPGLRDRLFFFGSINPSWGKEFDLSPATFGLSSLGVIDLRTNTFNYAGKVTYKINDKHQAEFSIFGDPSHTSTGPNRTLVIDNQTAFSKLEFGTRNLVGRYNVTLSPTWLANLDFTWGHNTFNETSFPNIYQVVDRTQVAGLPGQRGIFTAQGLGFFEPTTSNTYGTDAATIKDFTFAGGHTVQLGYRLEGPRYEGSRLRSGPSFPIPATNATNVPLTSMGVPPSAIGQLSNATFELRLAPSSPVCTLCPFFNVPGLGSTRVFLRQNRGEFGPRDFKTRATYHAAYAEDSWKPNKRLTVNAGLRWEIQRLAGGALRYSFTDNWLPRLGVAVDPFGDRRTKIYFNFGRYDYVLPLDVAERSLTNELDFTGARWAPDFTGTSPTRVATVNQFGTVTPVLDGAHLLNRAAGGTGGAPTISTQDNLEGFAPGTKMEYEDEYVVGVEREIGGIVFSARYVDRRLKRIIEDTGGISPEAAIAGVNQVFLIANVNKNLDVFTNPIQHRFPAGGTPPASCDPNLVEPNVEDTFGRVLGGVCVDPTGRNGQIPGVAISDGVPDGFPDPVRDYTAVEFEANKSFSHNWQMRANWRISRLFGNFEGAFRNDNGQSDPGISSLFDFTEGDFGLLGDQFRPGVLNTDRRHVVNLYTSYVVDRSRLKGMTLGLGIRGETGIPINDLKAHPVYLNSGEVPVNGRGSLGRTAGDGQLDLHLDYPFSLGERKRFRVGGDFFNILNHRHQIRVDQNEDASFGTKNIDFRKPVGRTNGFQRPFYARFFVRFEF